MESYLERIKTNAEQLFKDEFPKKALELDELINSKILSTSNIANVLEQNSFPKPEDFIKAACSAASKPEVASADKESPAAKKRKHEPPVEAVVKAEAAAADIAGCKVILFPGGTIKSNAVIGELLEKIEPFIIHFLDSSAIIKLWIQILIPQVEDFKAELSLQIQEDSLSEIRAIESEVATYLDHIYKYYTVRGKLIAKLAKYPHVADFSRCIQEFDKKMFMTARLVALELRNHYTSVHDILTKNVEKIKKPRNASHNSMY